MEQITTIQGKVIPLAMSDVDTDLIIPAQYLTSVSQNGFGEHLFARLKETHADFVFNLPQFKDAAILIVEHNFGCGSSREHAVWALQQAGIKAIIAVSYADIFFNNAAKNGLILIKQPEEVIKKLLSKAKNGDYSLIINLAETKISTQDNEDYTFSMDPFHQYCFMNGLDELDYLLAHKDVINQFWQNKVKHYFVNIT